MQRASRGEVGIAGPAFRFRSDNPAGTLQEHPARPESMPKAANLCNRGRPALSSSFLEHALMPATPDELFAYLDMLGIAHKTVTHPAVFTVEEARELRGAIAGGHTKNLFLRDKKGAAYLVVAAENAAVELRGLHRLLGASGRF